MKTKNLFIRHGSKRIINRVCDDIEIIISSILKWFNNQMNETKIMYIIEIKNENLILIHIYIMNI